MALSFVNSGAWVEASAGGPIVPALPAGVATGDMMLIYVHNKGFAATIDPVSGWTELGTVTDGSVSTGVDVGSVRTTVIYREATSAESGTVSVPFTGAVVNVALACARVFRKAAGTAWSIAGAGGGDASAGTGFSVTVASDPGITSGDMLVGGAGIRSDAGTQSAIALSATSATVGATTEHPTADGVSTLGNDLTASGGYAAVTAGTASAAPVYASTLAASHTGSAFIVRLREMAGAKAFPFRRRVDAKVYTQLRR